jgi:hypothetical protein
MTLLPGTSPFLRGTAYDKQRNTWFAAGNINPGTETPRVWSSTDLVNWTAITPQFPVLPNGYAKTRLRGLAYFRGALVSVVNDSGGGQWIVISKDGGTTWQHVTESTGSDVRIVTASDESSVAVLTVNAGAAALQITPRISL